MSDLLNVAVGDTVVIVTGSLRNYRHEKVTKVGPKWIHAGVYKRPRDGSLYYGSWAMTIDGFSDAVAAEHVRSQLRAVNIEIIGFPSRNWAFWSELAAVIDKHYPGRIKKGGES